MGNRRTGTDYRGTITAHPAVLIPNALDVPNMALWLRADQGITLNGSTVSTWADKSGAGNDFTQGTAANQPTFNSTGLFNGRPDLSFDGGDVLNSAAAVGGDTDWTIFTVLRQTTGGTLQRIANFSGSQGHAIYMTAGNARGCVLHTVAVQDDAAYTLNTNEIWCYKRDNAAGTKATLHVNGASQSITNANSVPAASNGAANVGGYNTTGEFIGRIAEVILYTRALTTNEQRTIEAYLGNRYAITVV